MALRQLDKLKSALVLLPAEGQFSVNLDPGELARHLREPKTLPTPEGLEITSVRDQMVVKVGGRIIFEDQSDATPGRQSRLPDVANSLIQMLVKQGMDRYRAYGWNFDVVFDAPGDETAASLIAHSFLDTRLLSERAQIRPEGAGITLFFEQSSARCQLNLQPHNQDLNTPRFFSHINYHYELGPEGKPPDLDALRLAYHGLWGSFLELLAKLVIS